MKEFIRDFHRRVAEIDKYFDLVDKIEQLGTFSSNSITFPSGEYTVDGELQKILKSHCYLLLYNLIESSIRNGITAIHDAISQDNLSYKDLSLKIRRIWLSNDISKSFIDSSVKKETIVDKLQEALKVVLDSSVISFTANNIPISGNLDAKTIQKLIDMYGFQGNLGIPKKEIDDILDSVVRVRCNLAHGNVSFSDASNQITWVQIVDNKEKTVQYLDHLLKNIDDFIDQKKYKI